MSYYTLPCFKNKNINITEYKNNNENISHTLNFYGTQCFEYLNNYQSYEHALKYIY